MSTVPFPLPDHPSALTTTQPGRPLRPRMLAGPASQAGCRADKSTPRQRGDTRFLERRATTARRAVPCEPPAIYWTPIFQAEAARSRRHFDRAWGCVRFRQLDRDERSRAVSFDEFEDAFVWRCDGLWPLG